MHGEWVRVTVEDADQGGRVMDGKGYTKIISYTPDGTARVLARPEFAYTLRVWIDGRTAGPFWYATRDVVLPVPLSPGCRLTGVRDRVDDESTVTAVAVNVATGKAFAALAADVCPSDDIARVYAGWKLHAPEGRETTC